MLPDPELLELAAVKLRVMAERADRSNGWVQLTAAESVLLADWFESAARDAREVGPDQRALMLATAMTQPPDEDPPDDCDGGP